MMVDKKILLLLLAIHNTSLAKKVVCDGLVFHDVYYDKELLFTDFGRPYNLVMHKFSGLLFFSHTIQNGTHADFSITSCHIERRECNDIKGVAGGYAIAYDPGNDDIFFGGHDGIYKYNFLQKSVDFFAEEGKSIWGLFVKKNFYYIEYPTQKLYVYQREDFVPVAESMHFEVDHFFISKRKEIYFSNSTALYKVESTKKQAVHIDDNAKIRQITEDSYGDVHFCTSDGIYIEDKPYHRIKKVAKINQAFGLTFDDNDHVVYSDQNAIYRLLPSKVSSQCLKTIKKRPKNVRKITPKTV